MNTFHTNDTIHVTSIELDVMDLDEMIDYYTHQLGLTLINQSMTTALLGTTERVLIRLNAKPTARQFRSAGLYHVALLLDSREEFTRFYHHALSHHLLDGAADHGVSEALYLHDPEGNGIEVYVDRPVSEWPFRQGQLAMISDPLQFPQLHQLETSPFTVMSVKTRIGHVHFHVRNLKESEKFYQQLGFDVMQHFGTSAAFLGHRGYHHHIGMNTWLGESLTMRQSNQLGLASVTLSIPRAIYNELSSRHLVSPSTTMFPLIDPNGIRLWISTPADGISNG